MPIVALKYYKDWQAASLTGGMAADAEGHGFLLPDNESPNPGWLDLNRQGGIALWGVEMPEREIGWYPLVSQGAAIPQNATLTRQTSTHLALGKDAWTATGPIALGYMPEFAQPSPLARPSTPIVEAILRTKKGFPAGFYGAAYGLRDEWGRRTPVSGVTVSETAVGEGQAIIFTVPQGLLASGARYVDLYLTKPAALAQNVNPATLRFQETIDLFHRSPSDWTLTGPLRSGKKPVDENRTGLVPPKPRQGGRNSDIDIAKDQHDLQEGHYRFAWQYHNERGDGLLGPFSETIEINSVRKNKAFFCAGPRSLPDGVSWSLWVQIQRDGVRVHYRVVRAGGRHPDSRTYDTPRRRHGERLVIHGVTDDVIAANEEAMSAAVESASTEDTETGDRKKKKRVKRVKTGPYVLVEESRPEEDGTLVEAPDVGEGPDPPVGTGQTWPTLGLAYRGAISKATSTGGETRRSLSARAYLRTSGEGGPDTLRISPVSDVNKLANATFSELSPPITANMLAGTPADWTFTGVSGAVTVDVDDGKLILSTGSTVDANPQATSKLWALPEGDQTNVTVLGTMHVAATTVGTARLLLDEVAEDGTTVLNTRVLLSTAHPDTGTRTLEPYGNTYGPNGSAALTAGTAYLQFRCQGLKTTSSWNQRIEFYNLGLFPFIGALRKGNRRPDAYAEYDLPPSEAYPEQAEYFVGPPPLPPGSTSVPPVAPLSVLDFESGFTTGAEITSGTVINSWTFNRVSTTNTDSIVEAGAASAGSLGWRVQDDNTTSGSIGIYAQRDFTGGMSGKSQAVRMLAKVSRLPTKGEHNILMILSAASVRFGVIRLSSTGTLTLYRFLSDALVSPGKTILSGIAAGDTIDVELGVVNEVDGSGILRASAGRNGPRSTTVTYSNVDWGAASPRIVRAGLIGETDATSKSTYRIDNVVVTLTGDVLDRETPAVPSGVTPPEPDRPLYPTWAASSPQVLGSRVKPTSRNGYAYEVTVGGTSTATVPTWPTTVGGTVTTNGVQYTNIGSEFRSYDVNESEIPQFWWFEKPGGELGTEWGLYNEEVIEVVPGQTYTHAVMARYSVFESEPDVDAMLPFNVTLEGEDLPALDMGSPFTGGATGTSAWGTTDRYHTVTVPAIDSEGRYYSQARIRGLNKHGSVFVAQEHLWARGSLTTQGERDAKRRYAVATSGSFTAVLDTRTPEVYQGGMALGNALKSIGVITDTDGLPAGNTVTGVTYRASETGTFSGAFITDPLLVPQARYYEIKGTLSGDGLNSPSIPPTGVYVSTQKIEPTLLRSDYSEFSGGTFLEGLEIPPERQEFNIVAEAGEVFVSAISDDRRFLKPFTIHVFSEEALNEIERIPPNGRLAIESAMIGGTGTRMIIQPNQVIDFDSEGVTAQIKNDDEGNPKRFVHATATIERAEVISRGDFW